LRAPRWTARDAIGVALAACAGLAFIVNALFLQSGLHPAPLFGSPSDHDKAAPRVDRLPVPPLRRMDTNRVSPAAAPRMSGEVITDIQRELLRRGFYGGTIDGLYGPRTDAAIREFEQAAGLTASAEPNEMLLERIRRAPAVPAKLTPSPSSPAHANQSAQDRIAPSPRVIALQRALSDYGYGQIKPTGIVDSDTQRAIEKFERDRNLPVTRQYSERLARELTALTGRVLE
jgi:peptidoglycan hydrolase-like protein with peptidoglycan-binding domain